MKQIISVLMAGAITMASCNSNTNNEKEAALRAQYTVDSMKQEMAKARFIDSVNQAVAAKNETPAAAVVERPVRTHTRTRTVYVHDNNNTSTASAGGSTTNSYSGYAQQQHKKGWSAKAKGAAIGAGVGALSGALIGKEKGKGAIIGGVLGAGAGLGTGAIIDAKKKKKDQQLAEEQR